MKELAACPACATPDREPVDEVRGFRLARCSTCGLEYTINPENASDGYARTYEGHSGVLDDPRPYLSPSTRLALERDAYFRPPPYLTAAERLAMSRIVGTCAPGSVVLDIGCGTGRFMEALRRRGYTALGTELAENVISPLRGLGYDVRRAQLPGLKWTGPRPSAITLFEVLEHIADPGPALRELRTLFAESSVAVSVPAHFKDRPEATGPNDYPPNHFLRWTSEALERAFRGAGYRRVEVLASSSVASELLPSVGARLPIWALRRIRGGDENDQGVSQASAAMSRPGSARRVVATAFLYGHWLWRSSAVFVAAPLAAAAARRGAVSAKLVVWAEP